MASPRNWKVPSFHRGNSLRISLGVTFQSFWKKPGVVVRGMAKSAFCDLGAARKGAKPKLRDGQANALGRVVGELADARLPLETEAPCHW
jgi:hypothetical protein